MIAISKYQFATFRVLLGIYLCAHFIGLLPYGAELFSCKGVLPDAHLNFTHGILPNPLEHWDGPRFVAIFLRALLALSVCLTLGIARRVCALLLWYGWACLFNRNNLISNPSIPYVGLLLLFCALLPPMKRWQFPPALFWVAWGLLMIGYTFSGLEKLSGPSWMDGTAMLHVANNPLARPNLVRHLFVSLPLWVIRLATWGSLALEISFLPLCLFRGARPWAWLAVSALQLGILTMINFADLTFGMLMFHLFVFDPRWLRARHGDRGLVLFDRVCGLCDRTVQFLLDEDFSETLLFAPLQGETAGQRMDLPADLRSVVFITHRGTAGERVYYKSEAVLRALDCMGGFWRVVSWLRIIPRFVRDAVYDFVAAHRYNWFGKMETCRVPAPELRGRFLP